MKRALPTEARRWPRAAVRHVAFVVALCAGADPASAEDPETQTTQTPQTTPTDPPSERGAETPAAPPSAAEPVTRPTPPPPPYSLPWQLRPIVAASLFRFDDSLAFYHDASGKPGVTNTAFFLGSYRPWRDLAIIARLGFVVDESPAHVVGASFVNPVLGAMYSFKLPLGFRIAPFLGVALPLGMGGGDTPDAAAAGAARAGVLSRSAMDNAMFAVNDLVIFPGVDIAWIGKGVTVQIEATILELVRVRGEKVQPDAHKTNLTCGLHVGYFPIRHLSIGVEARYQRWLVAPKAVNDDASGATQDNVSIAAGVRGHFKAGRAMLRPGVSYTRGLDDPMWSRDYNIIQFDLPVIF